jgi:hypothetical protein
VPRRLITVKLGGVLLAYFLASIVVGCMKNAQPSANTSPSAMSSQAAEQSPGAQASGGTGAPGEASSPGAEASPTEAATSSGPVDVVMALQGAFLRSWPPSSSDFPADNMVMDAPWRAPDGSSGPYVFVYELPAPASLSQIELSLGDYGTDAQTGPAPDQTIHLAVSTQSPTDGFSEVGTYKLSGDATKDFPISPEIKARWIKLTIDGNSAGTQLQELRIRDMRADAKAAK